MFNIMDEGDFISLFPNNNGFDIKEMDDETRENYFLLTSAYRYYLTKYLEEKVGLSKFDKRIETSELSFVPVDEKEMDFYQGFNRSNYKFIYLRNNIYIGNLSNEERNELCELIKSSELEYNEKIGEFIGRTFKKAIFEKSKDNDSININYGPISQSFFAPNDALIIGLRYDEYNSNGMSDEEWDKNHDSQVAEINNLRKELALEVESKLSINCHLLQYDEFSIVKKNVEIKK